MNARAIDRYINDWNCLNSPYRPTQLGLLRYRDSLNSVPLPKNSSVLILGSTPELIDLAIRSGVKNIVRMDSSMEILEAMEQLAEENWSHVETYSRDWLSDNPSWAGRFDLIWSDGGPLFLPFPSHWSILFEQVASWLKPGGLLETKIQSPPFDAEETDRKRQALLKKSPRQEKDFILQMADLWQLRHFDAVDANGVVDRKRVLTNHNKYRDLAFESFPGNHQIIQKSFERFLENDGMTSLFSLPNYQQLKPIIHPCPLNFVSETPLADSLPAPNYCWHLRLKKD